MDTLYELRNLLVDGGIATNAQLMVLDEAIKAYKDSKNVSKMYQDRLEFFKNNVVLDITKEDEYYGDTSVKCKVLLGDVVIAEDSIYISNSYNSYCSHCG